MKHGRIWTSRAVLRCVVVRDLSVFLCVCIGCHLLFFPICCGTVCLIQCDMTRCVNLVTSQTKSYRWVHDRVSYGERWCSYGIEIAKDQYPGYRNPNGAEVFDKGRILGRYPSGVDQIKGTARAKLGQTCLPCKRVSSPWSRTSRVVIAHGRGFVSS